MPILQSTKKRLSYDVFKTIASCYRFAEMKKVKVIESNVFVYFALTLFKDSLCQEYFSREKIDKMIELLSMTLPSHARGNVVLEDIELSSELRAAIRKSYDEPESISIFEILHTLSQIPEESLVKSILTQCDISADQFSYAVSKERAKRKGADKNSEKSPPSPQARVPGCKEDVVKKYCIDYNQKARNGDFSPVFCRDLEIDQTLVALMKKTKANPLLIGEPGVGKTAIVEALAQRLVEGKVPERFKDYRIISINMSSVVQGTTLRGQFEDRLEEILKSVIKDGKIIVFIDEMHTVIGSGGDAESGLDGSNIMKPYLARGEIKVIGATTFDDYYKRMRKDKAFSRRFQRIFVSEPDIKQTRDILLGLAETLETYHSCKINSDVVEHIVKLSRRFIHDRFFPDKAIDCLDHACAKASLRSGPVTKEIVEEVVSEFADVPVSVVRKGDMERLESVDRVVCSEILGNNTAISEFCNRVKFSYSTKDSRKGVLCSIAFYGPPGIGKKSVVKKMAQYLYGEKSLIVINGAEYSEPFSINRIIGSPPGYIGHNDETYIMREIRRHPNVVILVTNPELMHSTVVECIKDIVTTGKLTDVNEMSADFSNSIVVFCIDVESGTNKTMGFVAAETRNDAKEKMDALKKRSSVLSSCSYHICFSDVGESFKRDIVVMTVERVKSDLKNSCIIVHYDNSCIDFLLENVKGSPSELGKKIRGLLETAICNGFLATATEYDLCIIDNNLIAKARNYESCTV